MAILYVLVHAVLMFVGQSTACVEWVIENPPIIFGETARLSCVTMTSSAIYNPHQTSWLGGTNYSVLTYTGGTADPTKYAENWKWQRYKFTSTLQIYKFDEKDVNVVYAYSIDGSENRKKLSIASDKFEYHPDKDTTMVLASFRNGYLDVNMTILKVYPIPKCTIMVNENIIARRLTTKTSVNGIFYKVVERVKHYFDVCNGQLIVTCVVGNTTIPIHQESFNRCTKTKEESSEYDDKFIISTSAAVLLSAILVIGMSCLAKYGQLKRLLSCRNLF